MEHEVFTGCDELELRKLIERNVHIKQMDFFQGVEKPIRICFNLLGSDSFLEFCYAKVLTLTDYIQIISEKRGGKSVFFLIVIEKYIFSNTSLL